MTTRDRILDDAQKVLARYPAVQGYLNEPIMDGVIREGVVPGEVISTGSRTAFVVAADGTVLATRDGAYEQLAPHVTQDLLRHKALVVKAVRAVLNARGVSVYDSDR